MNKRRFKPLFGFQECFTYCCWFLSFFLCGRMAESADTKHQQLLAHDSTCVAARTRPLLSCRRRRLIQPNTVTNLNGKVGATADDLNPVLSFALVVELVKTWNLLSDSFWGAASEPTRLLCGPQAQRGGVQCACRVNSSCVMCSGRPIPREDPQYELPTLERLSKLDLGVHPILSFPDGQCCTSLFMQLFPVLHSEGKTNKAGPQTASLQEVDEALY